MPVGLEFMTLRSRVTCGALRWLSLLSVQLLISAQAMIPQFVGLSPASGSVLTVWSLLGLLPLSPFLSLSLAGALSLFLKVNK